MGLLRGRAWAAETGGWGRGGSAVLRRTAQVVGGLPQRAHTHAHTLPRELIYLCSGGGFGCETYRCSVQDSFICSQILEALGTRGRRWGWVGEVVLRLGEI